mmetsp:Transcript_8506/g.16831  ORF Transcript_8506/g.16831 Transcript_8506/m.16831 type:complete len:121 (+) Transcript_8506:187-549(+)
MMPPSVCLYSYSDTLDNAEGKPVDATSKLQKKSLRCVNQVSRKLSRATEARSASKLKSSLTTIKSWGFEEYQEDSVICELGNLLTSNSMKLLKQPKISLSKKFDSLKVRLKPIISAYLVK